MSTPTSRTLKLLRDSDYLCQVTEQWNSFTHTRKDLFGFIDCLAVGHGHTLGVQCTSTSNISSRITKIKTECRDAAIKWLTVGNKIKVIGWSKKGKVGKRKLWTSKIVELHLSDFEENNE